MSNEKNKQDLVFRILKYIFTLGLPAIIKLIKAIRKKRKKNKGGRDGKV
jgi:hypothetical protein